MNLFARNPCVHDALTNVCKELVNLLGGNIGAFNNLSKGATFWFTIDCNLKIDYPENNNHRTTNTAAPSKRVRQAKKVDSRKVLVVDDDNLNLSVLTKILNSIEASCECYHDGSEIIPLIDRLSEYSAIIIDCHMPQIDGIQVTKEIRKRGISIPIIGLSGDLDKKNECIGAGMNSFLLKPVKKDELTQTLLQHH